jgi:hypothetical protein
MNAAEFVEFLAADEAHGICGTARSGGHRLDQRGQAPHARRRIGIRRARQRRLLVDTAPERRLSDTAGIVEIIQESRRRSRIGLQFWGVNGWPRHVRHICEGFPR